MALTIQVSDDEQCALICQDEAGRVLAVYVGKGSESDAKDAIPQIASLTRHDGEWVPCRVDGSWSHGRGRRGSA